MTFIAFILSFILTHDTCAQEQSQVFHPHLTYDARPLGVGEFSFQTVPGMVSASTGSQYGLLVGVLPRLDIGIMPLPYLIPASEEEEVTHKSNFVLKVHFWKGEEWFWTFGMSTITLGIPPSAGQPFSEVTFVNSSFGANYIPHGSRWSYGLVLNSGSVTTDDDATNVILEDEKKDRQRTEWFLDSCYKVKDEEYLTLGIGQIRKNAFDDIFAEDLALSLGLSYTWERPTKTFTSPSLGLNYRTGKYVLILSTGINF